MWHACTVLVGKLESKRPLGRPRHRQENNMKMDLKEIGWGGTEWIHPAQNRDKQQGPVKLVIKLCI
jgi:hypothetical protein